MDRVEAMNIVRLGAAISQTLGIARCPLLQSPIFLKRPQLLFLIAKEFADLIMPVEMGGIMEKGLEAQDILVVRPGLLLEVAPTVPALTRHL